MKWMKLGVTAALCLSLLAAGGARGLADPSLDETKRLLQKSLTLYEIDQEIARLTEQEKELAKDIAETEQQIEQRRTDVEKTRQHAAKVVRAYYMGDRQNLWLMLFSAHSFSEALAVYDYLSMILRSDHRALNSYADSYKSLQDTQKKLETRQSELIQVKQQFIAQREKVALLQQEIDEQLRQSADQAALARQMSDFTSVWRDKGIPLFRKYFAALAETMQSLPDLIGGRDSSKYIKTMTLQNMVFEIGDADLTDFFRSKNKLFENLTFKFEDGQLIATGREDNMDVSIRGKYTIVNEPKNKLLFSVDQLTFNGYALPETSNRALEQEFDLGFTPELIVKQLEATDVKLENGKLTLTFRMKYGLANPPKG